MNDPQVDFAIGGVVVPPGQRRRLELPVARLPTHTMLSLPVTVINGIRPGARLWLSAAIHGDEINGIEIVRQVLTQIDPRQLSGSLIAVPIVNVFGFIEQSRYLPDRRDLNRSFPGSPRGSLAARLAHLFMQEVVGHCTHGIDLHTASHHRANWPHIRANLEDEETDRCARAFGTSLIVHAATRDGSLREAAARRGIPILLYEAGEALRFDSVAIQTGVDGILRVMSLLGMIDLPVPPVPARVMKVTETKWVRTPASGILHTEIALGQRVSKKQKLGYVADAFGDKPVKIVAPCDGIAIGSTQIPLVSQGDGIFHIAACSDTKSGYNKGCLS